MSWVGRAEWVGGGGRLGWLDCCALMLWFGEPDAMPQHDACKTEYHHDTLFHKLAETAFGMKLRMYNINSFLCKADDATSNYMKIDG